jgi:hypothetical protein
MGSLSFLGQPVELLAQNLLGFLYLGFVNPPQINGRICFFPLNNLEVILCSDTSTTC